MTKSVAPLTESPPTVKIFNYADEISHFNDELRPERQLIMFRLFSVGRGLGQRVNLSFQSDHGIFYDADDSYIISALQRACPEVNWYHNKVYHRCWDSSKIEILNAETMQVIGQIEVRRYMGRKITAEKVRSGVYGASVVNLEDLRLARQLKLAAEATDLPVEGPRD
jgi:hypothetical protein